MNRLQWMPDQLMCPLKFYQLWSGFSGSLLLMEGAVQEDWLHCLPKVIPMLLLLLPLLLLPRTRPARRRGSTWPSGSCTPESTSCEAHTVSSPGVSCVSHGTCLFFLKKNIYFLQLSRNSSVLWKWDTCFPSRASLRRMLVGPSHDSWQEARSEEGGLGIQSGRPSDSVSHPSKLLVTSITGQ